MELTPANVRVLRTKINKDFREAYELTPVWYPRVAFTVPSSTRSETYAWMAQLPSMKKWLGARVIENLLTNGGYTIVNETWESTIGVSRENIEDDNLGIYTELTASHAEQARKHPDDLVANLLATGHSTLCFDGQNYYDTDHPVSQYDAALGVYSNYSSTGMALTADNFASRRAAMMSYKGDRGQSLKVMPGLLQVPPALEVDALEIVKAERNASGATNVVRGFADVLVTPELAGADTTWYLHDASRRIKPFIFQLRRALNFQAKQNINDDVMLEDNELRFYADARYNVGYSLPFLSYKAVA